MGDKEVEWKPVWLLGMWRPGLVYQDEAEEILSKERQRSERLKEMLVEERARKLADKDGWAIGRPLEPKTCVTDQEYFDKARVQIEKELKEGE